MTISKDSYLDDLAQLRKKQNAVVTEIEDFKRRNGGIVPAEIEQIQSDAQKIVDELDKARKQHEGDKACRSALPRSRQALPVPQYGASGTGIFF